MSTIFDGYKKLSDKQIIDQLAILETINFSNIFRFYKNKLKDNTVETIKKILGTSEKEYTGQEDEQTQTIEFKEKELVENNEHKEEFNELYQLMIETKNELKKLSRDELDIRLKLSLCDKMESNIEDSNELLSLEIVNRVIKRYEVKSHLTPSQKMDAIYELYNDKILEHLKENPEILNKNKSLNITNPKVIIHMIIQTMSSWEIVQGSKKIDTEVLAQSVWMSAIGNVDKFTPLKENMPSYHLMPLDCDLSLEDSLFLDSKRNYKECMDDLELNDNKLQDLKEELESIENEILNNKSQILDLKSIQKENEKKLREIDVDLEYIENIYDPSKREIRQEELIENHQVVSKNHIKNESTIEAIKEEIKSLERAFNDLDIDKDYLVTEEIKLRKSRDETRHKYLLQADARYKKVKELWQNHYSKFNLDPQFIKEAVEYTIEDRVEIEAILEELHDTRNPRIMSSNFNKEQIENSYNLEFLLEEKVICLEYSVERDNLKVTLRRILESIE